jgi:hemolysin activation/secretion protein
MMRGPLARTIVGIACLAGSMAYLMGPTRAFAAPAPAVPGSADAGRVLENLKPLPEPTRAAPEVVVPLQAGVPAPAGAASALFLFKKVVLVGATAYDRKELEGMLADIFKPYVGQYMSVRKLYELTGFITQRYHKDGYALSKAAVPPQDLSDGVVRIQVVEGYIDAVETQGAYRPSSLADAILRRIRSYRPLKMKDLEHDMLLLNDLAGVTVQAVLKPPEGSAGRPAMPGATDLVLVFADVPAPASVSVDNYGSRYSGPYEMQVQTGINHLVMPYQQTMLSGVISLPQSHELQDIQLSHRIPLDAQGTTATVQAGYVRTEPGYLLTSSAIVSDAYNYGVAVSHPLIRSRAQNLYAGGELLVKDISTDALSNELYRDRLRIVSLTANGDLSDPYGGANLGQVKLSQGLDILGATKTGSLDLSRVDGHSDFTRLSGMVSRLQAINPTLRVYAAATGQYAWSPLLVSEQFGFGGQQFGRAYDASELTADDGVGGMAELRYSPPITIPNATSELFAFYDIGRLWNYGAIAAAESAASTGVGLRFAYGAHVTANLTLAQPLTREVAAPEYGTGSTPRVFVSVSIKH